MTIRLQLFIGCLILILIFILDFFVNQRLSRQVVTNTSYLNNSEAVIRNSNMLHKEMIEMQSAFRGFLLTSQESFLGSYYAGLKTIPVLMSEQRAQVSKQTQREILDSIKLFHAQWIEYADSLIFTKRDTLPESSRRYRKLFESKLLMEVGKKLNDKIGKLFSVFDAYEYHIRQERREVLQQSIIRTRDITLTLTFISIILALLSSFYFVKVISDRIRKMVDVARKISDGDFITINDSKKDEFKTLIDALNKMSDTLDRNFKELTKNNSELDQFAYVVSHDLKAPIRGISNIISWIEEDHADEISPEIRKNHALIKGRIDRLESMINGLLEYARVDRVKREAEEVDSSLLLKELMEVLVPPGSKITITHKMPVLRTEKILLEQVFSNLISNAVKYNDKPSVHITIDVQENSEFYTFSVSDNGKGIEENYFNKIFVIFQTLQERDAFESTGVGLAIVKKIIEDKKGMILVSSKLGVGSTFTFTWPKQSYQNS